MPFNLTGKPYQLVNINLKEKSKVFFSVVQTAARFVPNSAYSSSFVKIMIARDINYDTLMPLEFLYSHCLNADSVTVESEGDLPPGDYVALVEIDWKIIQPEVPKTYVFSTYSKSKDVTLSFSAAHKNIASFDYLAEILKSCARQRSQRKNYADKGFPDIFRCASITDSEVEYGYIYYQNDSRNGAILKETVVFNKLENFTLMLEEGDTSTKVLQKREAAPFGEQQIVSESNNLVHVRVPAGSNALVIMRRTDRQASYQVTFYTAAVFPEEQYLHGLQTLVRGQPEKEVKRIKETLQIKPSSLKS